MWFSPPVVIPVWNDFTQSLRITLTSLDQKSESQKIILKVSSEKRTLSPCVCKCQLIGCFVSNSVTGCNYIFKCDQSVHITFGTSVYMWLNIGVKRGSGINHKPQSLPFLPLTQGYFEVSPVPFLYVQCWEVYFGNIIGYRLQVTVFKT